MLVRSVSICQLENVHLKPRHHLDIQACSCCKADVGLSVQLVSMAINMSRMKDIVLISRLIQSKGSIISGIGAEDHGRLAMP